MLIYVNASFSGASVKELMNNEEEKNVIDVFLH